MCYYFMNFVIKSVGERFDSLCWCRLKSGEDLIFASNLPGKWARGDARRRNRLCCEIGFCVCIIMCYYFLNFLN